MREDASDSIAGKRILIVEDERMIALYMRDLLEGWGCKVVGPARSVGEALDLIADVQPDAAVLDYDLTDETTEPVAEALQKAGRPLVITTALDPQHLGPHAARAPIVAKPVNEARLHRVLADLLTSNPDRAAGDRS